MKGRILLATIIFAVIVGVGIFFITKVEVFSNDNEQSEDVNDDIIFNGSRNNPSDREQAYILPVSDPSYIPILDSNIIRPKIDAKAAIVYDVRSSRFLYQENIRLQLPIASLTKVLTATVVLEKLNQNDVVTIGKASLKVDGQKQDLYEGEQLLVSDLLRMMLISSSNDAAMALLEHAKGEGLNLVELMNEKARIIGMDASEFHDPAGLNDTGFSTVYDLIKLVKATTKYRQIWDTLTEQEVTITSVDGKIKHTVKNTDVLLGVIPNIIGGKTGNTDGALGCLILLVSIPEYNDTIVSVVLGSRDRFGDTQKIIDWVKRAYRWE